MISTLAVLTCLFQQPTPESVFRDWLAALNSKEIGQMEQFSLAHTNPPPGPAERAQRMLGVAQQGAPFRLIRVVKVLPGEIRVIIQDRNQMELGAVMRFDGPEFKVKGILLAPPDGLDAPPPKDYSGWSNLRGLAEAIQKDTDCPAIGVAVVRGGKLAQAVVGVREIGKNDPVVEDDPWSIGSIGKPLCTSLIGKLVEAGKLRWDMPLTEALKGIPMRPEYEAVTLEQIMHHRGCIPADLNFNPPMVQRIVGSAKSPMAIRENYAKDILSRPMIGKPGTQFVYSNAGFALLSVVIEHATGKPYEQAIREMLFKPLGMSHSYIGASTYPSNLPSGHVSKPGGGLAPENFRGPLETLVVGAGGGIYLSVSDLARFGQAHLWGLQGKDGFLKAATICHLHQGIPEGGPDGGSYACGWGIRRQPGLPLSHGHNGSNGTFRAALAIYPESDLVVAAIVNRGGEGDPSPSLQAVMAVARKYMKG